MRVLFVWDKNVLVCGLCISQRRQNIHYEPLALGSVWRFSFSHKLKEKANKFQCLFLAIQVLLLHCVYYILQYNTMQYGIRWYNIIWYEYDMVRYVRDNVIIVKRVPTRWCRIPMRSRGHYSTYYMAIYLNQYFVLYYWFLKYYFIDFNMILFLSSTVRSILGLKLLAWQRSVNVSCFLFWIWTVVGKQGWNCFGFTLPAVVRQDTRDSALVLRRCGLYLRTT